MDGSSVEQGKRLGASVKGAGDGKHAGKGKENVSGQAVRDAVVSDGPWKDGPTSDGRRPPLQLMGLLATGKPTEDERARQLRSLRGKCFAEEDRERVVGR